MNYELDYKKRQILKDMSEAVKLLRDAEYLLKSLGMNAEATNLSAATDAVEVEVAAVKASL